MFRIQMLKSILVVIGVILFVQADAAGKVNVYLDPDNDGVYYKAKSYDVTYEEVLRAFSRVGGSPAKGYEGEKLVAFMNVPGVTLEGVHSWDGFMEFLDREFGSRESEYMPLCDDEVTIDPTSITWKCAGLQCIPEDLCTGLFHTGRCNFICDNIPPCPELMRCAKIAAQLNLVSFQYTGDPCCQCDFENNCDKPGGTVATGPVVFDNDVCECKDIGVPSHTEWGLVILVVLLLASAVFIFLRRKKVMVSP